MNRGFWWGIELPWEKELRLMARITVFLKWAFMALKGNFLMPVPNLPSPPGNQGNLAQIIKAIPW